MQKKILAILFSLVLFLSLSAFCLIRSTGVANNGQNRCCGGLLRWWHPNTHPVRILIDEAGSPQAPGALTHNAVRAAMNTWNRVRSSYFRFADGGLTNQKTISKDLLPPNTNEKGYLRTLLPIHRTDIIQKG